MNIAKWAWLTLAAMMAAGGARAAEDHLWTRAGATWAGAAVDHKTCAKEADFVPVPRQSYAVAVGGAAGYLMESVALNLAAHAGAEPNTWAGQVFLHRCMRRLGYVWLPLTPDEAAGLRLAGHEGKAAWVDRLYATDLTARVAAAAKPLVPPLPEGAPEPLTYDGLRFDPATLVVAKGVAPDGSVVLSGTVTVAHTARTRHAVVFPGPHGLSVDAGAIYYQVVGPAAFDRQQTYWCGPFHIKTLIRTVNGISCVSISDEGYEVWDADGGPPIAGPPGLIGSAVKDAGLDFSLEPSDQDLIGPLQFSLKASWQNLYNVFVEADVTASGHRAAVFKAIVPYAADGTAVLPFWSHRLVLHRTLGQGVTVEFKPDGDGKGWLDVKPPA